jgi:hypothetical protein
MSRIRYSQSVLLAVGVVSCFLLAVVLPLSSGWRGPGAARADEHNKSGEDKPPHLDADKIGKAAGTKATTTPDGVVRIAWARTDVALNVDGLALKPFAEN